MPPAFERPLDIQLWSYNYAPEPTGIAPLSATWAGAMASLGHEIDVVAAHPHYPAPVWGRRIAPRRELRDGIDVLRLPIWPGRATGRERIRQELSYATALTAALPALSTPDVVVAVSPSFPALGCAMVNARARGIPWVLWLQDILPDGAASTGILADGPLIAAARRFERKAYRSASAVVAISHSFRDNLIAKGVPASKIATIHNPASRPIRERPRDPAGVAPNVVLAMGNVGHTQNLTAVARAFIASDELARQDARLVIAGDGVAGDAVRAESDGDRVAVTGVLDSERLERELMRATVGLVSQRYEGRDFNVPSKLMNYLGYGVPVVALVRPDSEVAALVRASGAGWVCDASDPASWGRTLAHALQSPEECAARGEAGRRYAREHFSPARVASAFSRVLTRVAVQAPRPS